MSEKLDRPVGAKGLPLDINVESSENQPDPGLLGLVLITRFHQIPGTLGKSAPSILLINV